MEDDIPLGKGVGSSPLARGLRSRHWRSSGRLRIIPARAGFTATHRRRLRPGPDHPRSRGVYSSSSWSRSSGTGSSPLARGLRLDRQIDALGGGIIPARAGFTTVGPSPTAPSSDHPRSRGVYTSAATNQAPSSGSSPLARGLRVAHRVRGGRPRIIPARAGFTSTMRAIIAARSDHPRSRGVYGGPPRPAATASGSSPLARGLRLVMPTPTAPVGIIPARAGFTSTSSPT